ncbi:MAG TPA: pitrilysin family protein [Anaerolineae bacterium]|nr:pitrilysin family protein [Anaerolineae bacterium]
MKLKFLSMLVQTMILFTVLSCDGSKKVTKGLESPIAPFTRMKLDNGLDVIIKEVHTAPIVAVYLWCNTGSIYENEHEQGISHFYEHMFFKGTEKRGVGEIDRAIKSIGGYNNAFTSKEYTAYYVVLPSENFSLAADVLIDAIRNPSFPEQEIEKELGVIKEEINRKEDDPSSKLYDELFKIVFPGTPYAHSVLGTKEGISGITQEDFKNYLAKFYVPNNMTAVIVGDVDTQEVVEELKRLTVDWEPDPEIQTRLVRFNIPEREGIQGFELEKDVNMLYTMIAFQTAGIQDIKENAVLDVASSILGEGRSSRLYRRLVEKDQLVSSVNAFIYPFRHTGLFIITATMDRDSVQKFRKAILEEIETLRNEPVYSEELKKAQTMLKADFQFSNETDANIGQTLGYYNTQGMLDQVTRYEQMIDEVTASDITTYALKVLDPASYSIGIINPRMPGGKETEGE